MGINIITIIDYNSKLKQQTRLYYNDHTRFFRPQTKWLKYIHQLAGSDNAIFSPTNKVAKI